MTDHVYVLGKDMELGNVLLTDGKSDGRGRDAADLLLKQIPGVPRDGRAAVSQYERGRRFLVGNGGSAYIDLEHLELNLPEHRSAVDHPRLVHGFLRIADRARAAVQRGLPYGTTVSVLANCGDGRTSWGSHLNVCIPRRLFDDLMQHRRPQVVGLLATHFATVGPMCGQGTVGAGNGRSACTFQWVQRADFTETMMAEQTTYERPLINRRAEHHTGSLDDEMARLHVIPFDNCLAPFGASVGVGSTQLVLAMLDAGWLDPSLQVDDPVTANWEVSRDLSLRTTLPMAQRRKRMTAVEIQRAFAEAAGEFVAEGHAGGIADAERIVERWLELVTLLEERDAVELARRCDGWLKYRLIDQFRGRRGLTWSSPTLKALDLVYASVDPDEGLYLKMAADGFVLDVPTDAEVERAIDEPPVDTRACLRAHALRRFEEYVHSIDWDHVRFRVPNGKYWSSFATLRMHDPTAFGLETTRRLLDEAESVDDFVELAESATEFETVPT